MERVKDTMDHHDALEILHDTARLGSSAETTSFPACLIIDLASHAASSEGRSSLGTPYAVDLAADSANVEEI